MEITEVKVFPVNEEKLKAFVSIVFDRCFMVNDVKIIQGRDGLFISMPSRKKKNGEFKDIAHPLNNDTRRRIELDVVKEYERVLAQRGESLPAPARAHNLGESTPGDAAAAGNGGRGGDTAEDEPMAQAPVAQAPAAPAPAAQALAAEAPEAPRVPAPATAERPPETAAEKVAAAGRDAASDNGDGSSGAAGQKADQVEDQGDDSTKDDNSLEEVQEKHLRDSFWSVS